MAEKNRLAPIPKPDGHPIIGNALTIDADAPLQSLMDVTREQGPIFWMDMMGTPIVMVAGASLVKELCDETRFDKTVRGALRRLRSIGGDGLFTGDTDAPNWSKAHNILMPTFSQKSMKDYLPMMTDIADQLMMKWERLNSHDEVDVAHDMIGLTLDTIGLCGFDYRFNSVYTENFHPFIDAMSRTLELSMLQRGLPLENVTLRSRLAQLPKDVAFMNNLVDEIIRERRQTGGDQKDLLNYMLAGVDPITGEGLSDENIRYQINTFLIAGHETTSGLLSFTLYYLLKNSDVLTRAYREVDEVLGHDISIKPTFAQIGQLEYVRAILLETLRLWPTAPAFSVSPLKDELIGGKYPLKKGTFVTVLALMLHRDTEIWGEDPDTFNPENFTRESEAARPPEAYKPFGNGQRACIGRQFALQEAVLVIGMILQRFQIFDHNKYELTIKETLSLKPDGFKIKVKQRPEVVRGTGTSNTASAAPAPSKAQRAKHGTPLCVLYGSNLGTSEGFAREIAQAGELNGFDPTLAPLDEFTDQLPKHGAVIIVSASYNGTPPNNATKFVDWITAAEGNPLDGVNFAVMGCGNRDWASTFQTIPRFIDERLEALGATRLMERGEADAREDLETQFADWADLMWPKVGDALKLDIDFSAPAEAAPLYHVEVAESVTANPVASQAGTVLMKIVENRELQRKDGPVPSDRSTRHVEVELPEGVTYQTGDHLCVVPVNPPALVKRALSRFGFDDDAHIKIESQSGMRSPFPSGSTFSVKRLAQVFGELQAVASRRDVMMLAVHTNCPHSKPRLEALGASAKNGSDLYRTEVFLKRKSVLDLMDEFPACELPFAVFLEMVPWLSPRYYSISSSPALDPKRCSITVGVVEGPARSGTGDYFGICSNFLANARIGDEVQAVVKEPSTDYRLPKDPYQPIIMVGPGTGLAPFRGFVQERLAQKASGNTIGPALLFFGCRHPEQDFLYEDELKKAVDDGVIELHTAFSRLTAERIYVQDVLRQQGDSVWAHLENGATIYVCGDGAAMEPDVKRTLIKLCAEKRDISFQDAEIWMEELTQSGRYLLDVWAG